MTSLYVSGGKGHGISLLRDSFTDVIYADFDGVYQIPCIIWLIYKPEQGTINQTRSSLLGRGTGDELTFYKVQYQYGSNFDLQPFFSLFVLSGAELCKVSLARHKENLSTVSVCETLSEPGPPI